MDQGKKPLDSRFRLAMRKADMSLDVEGHGLAVSLAVVALIVVVILAWVY